MINYILSLAYFENKCIFNRKQSLIILYYIYIQRQAGGSVPGYGRQGGILPQYVREAYCGPVQVQRGLLPQYAREAYLRIVKVQKGVLPQYVRETYCRTVELQREVLPQYVRKANCCTVQVRENIF